MPRVTAPTPSHRSTPARRTSPGALSSEGIPSTMPAPATVVSALFYALLLLLAPGCEAGSRSAPVPERLAEAPKPVPSRLDEPGKRVIDFVLTDQNGQPFETQSVAGRVWVGSVFFSNCPGPCFRENQALADLLREIDDPDLMVVSLTCDPDNDTPDVLNRYADRFDADTNRWKFLTGDMEVIKKIANESFQLPAEVGVHSERGVVFDRQGRLRGGFHLLQADRVDLLKKLVRDVLAEGPEDASVAEATPDSPTPGSSSDGIPAGNQR